MNEYDYRHSEPVSGGYNLTVSRTAEPVLGHMGRYQKVREASSRLVSTRRLVVRAQITAGERGRDRDTRLAEPEVRRWIGRSLSDLVEDSVADPIQPAFRAARVRYAEREPRASRGSVASEVSIIVAIIREAA